MRRPARYPYRTVGEVEDVTAHLLELLRLLEEDRRAAATPAQWHRLNAQTRHAEIAYLWLREMRAGMGDEDPDGAV